MTRSTPIWLLLCTVLCSRMASAQIIQDDGLPAPTVATLGRTEDVSRPAQGGRSSVFGEIFASGSSSSNPLALSNMLGGFELEAQRDLSIRKGAAVGVAVPLSRSASFFVRGEGSHTNYREFSSLNYIQLSGSAGFMLRSGRQVSAIVAGACSTERDAGTRTEYFRYCVPLASVTRTAGDPYAGNGSRQSAYVIAPMGKADDYARYIQAGGSLGIEKGGRARFVLEPRGFLRWYSLPDTLTLGRGERRDYQVSIRSALLYRSDTLELGVEVEPRVNWSNYAQYRYWAIGVGPFGRWRFGS